MINIKPIETAKLPTFSLQATPEKNLTALRSAFETLQRRVVNPVQS
jgi:hypothetical protein